jgi:hypothetical protein
MHDMNSKAASLAEIWKGGKGNDPCHPHQIWLKASREDSEGILRAFTTARAGLEEQMLLEVLGFCDNVQYQFITRLTFRSYVIDGHESEICTDNEGKHFVYVDTIGQAFEAAKKEQEAYLAEQAKNK